jgi:hypothetical protein
MNKEGILSLPDLERKKLLVMILPRLHLCRHFAALVTNKPQLNGVEKALIH